MSSPDEVQQRYVDELVAASVVLESLETAAQAEAWVSGAVAEWYALEGPDGVLEAAVRPDVPVVADLLAWFNGGDVPDELFPWVADLGRHELARVLCLTDSDVLDEQALIFEYVLDGQPDHDVSVSIADGVLLGVSVGPAGLAEGIGEGIGEDLSSDLQVTEMDPAAAVALTATALAGPLDQLSPASEANVPLLAKRIDAHDVRAQPLAASRPLPERDADDDAWCVGVVRSSLRKVLDAPVPDVVERARAHFAESVEARLPDALTVLEVAGLGVVGSDPAAEIDVDVLVHAVGGYFNPVDLSAHTDAQFAALVELEPVDWAGVVLGMVRSTTSAPIDGSALVTFINRAPEITSTIPKNDAPRIAWAFEQMLFAWEVTGVLDGEGHVTEAGRWLLAHGFVRALSQG